MYICINKKVNMKNILFLISLVFVVGFSSCKKQDPIQPSKGTVIYNDPNVNPVGTSWELYSGKVYTTNLDNNTLNYYDHFGGTKNNSNLDIFSNSFLPLDIITKGLTTWKFTSTGQFVLDNNTTYTYNFNSNNVYTVFGLENGSARPIEVLKSTENFLYVKIYESNGNNGTNNFSFYSILTFVKSGFVGTVEEYQTPYGYTYGGILNGNITTTPSLTGTKWVVTKFIQNMVSTYPNDTLTFVSNTQYKINNSTVRNYNVSNIVGSTMKSLSLYSFTTLGGDWSGQVQGTFINDWVINNSSFVNIMSNTTPETRVWVTRIQ